MPRLGLLHARDLPQAASLEGPRAQLSGDSREDSLGFVHAPAGEVAQTPQGLIPGVNLFGPGQSPAMTASPGGLAPVREATSVLLHDALFVAHFMTVVDRHNRLFRDGLDNLADPALLAGWGEPWEHDPEGALCLADGYRGRAQHSDCIALPICGIGLPNYGHFLFDGLPLVLLHAHVFADLPWRVVGQSLRPWQSEILGWHLYLARVDAPPEAAGQPCSYEIDPLDLMTTVARIEAAA